MKRILALFVTVLAFGSSAHAQTAAPAGLTIHILSDEPFGGSDKMHTIVGITDWAVGGTSIRHFHAGDEYALVLEGAIEVDNDGEPPHIYKAGQTYHNKRGVVHVTKNANDGPSKLTFVLIADKDQPMQVPAK